MPIPVILEALAGVVLTLQLKKLSNARVGFLNLLRNRSPTEGYIVDIYTPENLRRRGFGSAMTAALANSAIDAGRIARLSVDISNDKALRIYKKLGFKRMCTMENWRLAE